MVDKRMRGQKHSIAEDDGSFVCFAPVPKGRLVCH